MAYIRVHRMRRILLILTIATTCYAACPSTAISVFRNNEWLANNVVVKLFNFFYDSIALTSEDLCSPAKRFISIFSCVKTIYLTTNCTDIGNAISIAKSKARKQLKNSAAAIAGTFRGAVDRILSIIDQPMNDIFTACTPDTYQDECQKTLNEIRNRNERQCKGYSKHVAFHKRVTQWANNQDSIAYIDEVITNSNKKYNDTAILDFFEKLATSKYKSTFQELRTLFMEVKSGGFNCNALSFANSLCA